MKTLEELQRDWNSILGTIERANSGAAGLLKSNRIRPTGFEGGRICLSSRNIFFLGSPKKAEYKQAIEQVLTEYVGEPVEIYTVHNPDLEKTADELEDERIQAEEDERISKEYEEERRKERLELDKQHSRIPVADFTMSRFEDFEILQGNKAAFIAAKAFADRVRDREYHALTLVGACGLGKTHLAKAVAIEFINKQDGLSCLYYPVPDLLDDLKKGLGDNSYIRLMEEVKDGCYLLVLDDCGMEKNTEWSAEKIDQIINYRIDNGFDLIVTTNKTARELSPRVASRLQLGEVVVLSGNDYRAKKATKLKQGLHHD